MSKNEQNSGFLRVTGDVAPGIDFHLNLKEVSDSLPVRQRIRSGDSQYALDSESLRRLQVQWDALSARVEIFPQGEDYHVNGGWSRLAEDFIVIAKGMTVAEKQRVLSGGTHWCNFSGYARTAWMNYLESTIRFTGLYSDSATVSDKTPFSSVSAWLSSWSGCMYKVSPGLKEAFHYLSECRISVLDDVPNGEKTYEVSRDDMSVILSSRYAYPTFIRAMASAIAINWMKVAGTVTKKMEATDFEIRLPSPTLPSCNVEGGFLKDTAKEISAFSLNPAFGGLVVGSYRESLLNYSAKPTAGFGVLVRNDLNGKNIYVAESGNLKVMSIYSPGTPVTSEVFGRCGSSLPVVRAALQHTRCFTPHSDNYLSRSDCLQLISDAVDLEQSVWAIDIEESSTGEVTDWSLLSLTSDTHFFGSSLETLLSHARCHPKQLWVVKGIYREWKHLLAVSDFSLRFEGDQAFGLVDVGSLLSPLWHKENQHPHKANYGTLQIKLCLLWLLRGTVVSRWVHGAYVPPILPRRPSTRVEVSVLELYDGSRRPDMRGGSPISWDLPPSPYIERLQFVGVLRHYFSSVDELNVPVDSVFTPNGFNHHYRFRLLSAAREISVVSQIRAHADSHSDLTSSWFSPFFSLIPAVYCIGDCLQVGVYSDTVRCVSSLRPTLTLCVEEIIEFLSATKGF